MNDWSSNNTAMTISGLGSLASAYGQYKSDKAALDYKKKRDKKMDAKYATAQKNLEDAFDASPLSTKKKTAPTLIPAPMEQ